MKKILLVIGVLILLVVVAVYLRRSSQPQPAVESATTTDLKSELDKTVDDGGEMQLKDLEKDVSGL